MIDVELKIVGLHTHATCAIQQDGGRVETFSEISNTGAKALTSLVEALRKNYAGQPWQVVGDPKLAGIVPSKLYRRPSTPRKKLRERQASWC